MGEILCQRGRDKITGPRRKSSKKGYQNSKELTSSLHRSVEEMSLKTVERDYKKMIFHIQFKLYKYNLYFQPSNL